MHNYQVKLFIPMLKGAYLAIIHFSQIVKRKKSSYSQRISAGLKVKKCNVKMPLVNVFAWLLFRVAVHYGYSNTTGVLYLES